MADISSADVRRLLAVVAAALRRREVLLGLGAAAAALLAGGIVARRLLAPAPVRVAGAGGGSDATRTATAKVAGSLTPEEAAHDRLIEADLAVRDALDTQLADVGGLAEQIREVEELILLPLSHPHLFRHSRIAQRPTGVLLYGPPGTGKTLLARAIACTAKANFLPVNVAHRAWRSQVRRSARLPQCPPSLERPQSSPSGSARRPR